MARVDEFELPVVYRDVVQAARVVAGLVDEDHQVFAGHRVGSMRSLLSLVYCVNAMDRHERAEVVEPSKPPLEFWREVPCGHPPNPVACRTESVLVCHCGQFLDFNHGRWLRQRLVASCDNCGCLVAHPLA